MVDGNGLSTFAPIAECHPRARLLCSIVVPCFYLSLVLSILLLFLLFAVLSKAVLWGTYAMVLLKVCRLLVAFSDYVLSYGRIDDILYTKTIDYVFCENKKTIKINGK